MRLLLLLLFFYANFAIASALDETTTATHTNVASSASSVSLLAANVSRKAFSFYNDSTQIAYVKKGSGSASSSSYWLQMAPGSFYESNGYPIYKGAFTVIWASANGNMRVVTEQ